MDTYDELIYAPGLYRYKGQTALRITNIYVSQLTTAANGERAHPQTPADIVRRSQELGHSECVPPKPKNAPDFAQNESLASISKTRDGLRAFVSTNRKRMNPSSPLSFDDLPFCLRSLYLSRPCSPSATSASFSRRSRTRAISLSVQTRRQSPFRRSCLAGRGAFSYQPPKQADSE